MSPCYPYFVKFFKTKLYIITQVICQGKSMDKWIFNVLVLSVGALFIVPSTISTVGADIHYWRTGNSGNETEYWAVVVSTFENQTFMYDTLLHEHNWNESRTRLLYLSDATRDNILDALDWLAENVDADDIVVFSDNSHGSYKRGVCGVCPWDYHEEGIITKEELDAKFDNINAYGMCLIFDCCFSGNLVDTKTPSSTQDAILFQQTLQGGIEGENRVILMETRRFGTGFQMGITNPETNETEIVTFSKFVADCFREKIDNNDDGICSAEESFYYARKEFRPYAIFAFLLIKIQILSFIASGGFFIIPFPTIYDGFQGELPIVFT